MIPPTRRFWLGIKIMETLAIEEGVSMSLLIPIHNLIRNGFSEGETKEFVKSVLSYLHVGQYCFPLCRPDGITSQHFNITQLPFEIETDLDTNLSQE